ncbi:MAG: 1-acyl-sn-glycerol-3-phosphate acyltransferase [marine bacterium B5-7]|nr:MAG: 1-acyl-sn-glycerol-3-phosphate acyltransferase [marine bacterium B5-7]
MWTPDRIWRLIATALLYVVFGAGSIVLMALVMFPLSIILFFSPKLRVRCFRKSVQISFAMFLKAAEWLGVLSVQITNDAELRHPGQLIIANHPSLLDVVILISRLPNVDCVIKQQLSRNPFVSLQVWLADYIRNDSAEELVKECARRLESGRSLIIFPEGTRTRRGQRPVFLRGTARIILLSSAPLRPVLIHCNPHSLAKGDHWYRIPEKKINYRIVVEPCLNIDHCRQSREPNSLRSRSLTGWLECWFVEHLESSTVK